MRVLVTRWSCGADLSVLKRVVYWAHWTDGLWNLEGEFAWCSFSLTLDFMSFCPIMASTYFSASALEVEVLPLACSKKRVKFEIRAESGESFARVLHSVWCHYDNFFTWLEIKAVFWSEICCINRIELCNHPFKRYRLWRRRPWISKKSLRQIISSTLCDSCSGGVVLFYSKFQESEDRQMVPFVKSCWILF